MFQISGEASNTRLVNEIGTNRIQSDSLRPQIGLNRIWDTFGVLRWRHFLYTQAVTCTLQCDPGCFYEAAFLKQGGGPIYLH